MYRWLRLHLPPLAADALMVVWYLLLLLLVIVFFDTSPGEFRYIHM
ncbi:MAG: hypothetical protein RB296_00685 [Acidobacteriota bacterium]|jgi:hypothetical protein|nr:hypothetical protein [Acidobacteriota bacterium]